MKNTMRARYVSQIKNGKKTHVEHIDDEITIIEIALKQLNKIAKESGLKNIKTAQSLWDFCDFLILVTRSVLSQADFDAATASLHKVIRSKNISDNLSGLFHNVRRFFNIPADPRAGLNLSGLWVTQMLTSAIVMATSDTNDHLALRNEVSMERAILRCAALLYSLGRPGAMDIVPESTVRRAKILLDGLVNPTLANQIFDVLRADDSNESVRLITTAYEFVISKHKIRDLASRSASELFQWSSADFDSSDKWAKISDDMMNKLITNILDALVPEYEYDEPTIDAVPAILLADVSGIQNYISSTDRLGQLQGASLMIDGFMKNSPILERLHLPSLHSVLIQYGIPLESIVASGGGNLTLVVGNRIAAELGKEISLAFAKITRRVRIILGSSKFDPHAQGTFLAAYSLAKQRVVLKKNDLATYEPSSLYLGLETRCFSCGVSPATLTAKVGSSEHLYCSECNRLQKIGQTESFRAKFKKHNGETVLDVKWSQLSPSILEFIAGNTPWIDSADQHFDLAMVKADANLAGQFMAKSTTLSALVEKNILLTQVLDSAIENAQKWLVTTVKQHLTKLEDQNEASYVSEALRLRLILGVLYAGGDDLVLVAPSQYVLPYVIKIGTEFISLLGKALGMSFGIVTFSSKSPIRLVMESAEYLLDFCKTVSRPKDNQVHEGQLVIDYEMIKGSAVAPRAIVQKHEQLRDQNFDQRPLIMDGMDHDIIRSIVGLDTPQSEILDQMVRLIIEHDHILRKRKQTTSALRKFWLVASEILDKMDISQNLDTVSATYTRSIGAVFSLYMMGRAVSKKRDKDLYRTVGLLSLGDVNNRMGLIDAAIFSRIMMGCV